MSISSFGRAPLFSFFIYALLLTFFLPAAQAQETQDQKSMAILPFQVHASQDLQYLKNGIREMLASRLSSKGNVRIIDRQTVQAQVKDIMVPTPDQFPGLSAKMKSDYLISGSFTSLGGGGSLDAKVYNAGTGQTENFFATALKEEDVIQAINSLSADIGEKVLGIAKPEIVKPVAAPVAPQMTQTGSGYQTAHPDRAFLGYGGSGAGSSPFIRPDGVTNIFGFIKSQNLSLNAQAMDVGDVNGDGAEDVIIAGKTKIAVYQRHENRFSLLGEIPVSARFKPHYVSVADLNNNGKVEIYVSTNDNIDPDSFALEWQDGKLGYLFKDANYYIRAMQVPNEGEVLVGQSGAMDQPFHPGLYILNNDSSGAVTRGKKLTVPKELNIFDFSFADLDMDGRVEIVSINQKDKIIVSRQSGKKVWKSSDYFGGTKRFVGEPQRELSIETDVHEGRYYIPARLITIDLNSDQKPDIVVNRNLATASRAFKNLKSYPDGELYGLAWNGLSLSELWHTRKIDGYIADYQLTETDDQGHALLYVVVVLSSELDEIFHGNECTVLIYPMDLKKNATQSNQM